jgi:hypothetical protein
MIPRLPDVKPPCLTRPGNIAFPGRLFVRLLASWGVCGATSFRCFVASAVAAVCAESLQQLSGAVAIHAPVNPPRAGDHHDGAALAGLLSR